ncbi:hypothetical protein [Actinophytocola algeriensis]|uniref:Uncharacterized protein n=1 Tax=Actinophytocola algeriensis TaxID=1768010 RepID=A0A7W7Q3D5_9PSEU|nr:hypothetical protein [Actinophytocola algeriensis]MBB4906280.1 hypothetical protein [Actinophytocola algeriensis]MBE1477761.1 hypothetical protein [Actinophytocola algeriensis]
MRVTMGIAGGLILCVIGYLVYAAVVFWIKQPMGEPAPSAPYTARTLAGRLDFAMTDQEITDEAAKLEGSIVELHRKADETVVLVRVPAAEPGPTSDACYRFRLRNGDVGHHVTGCPDTPPTSYR